MSDLTRISITNPKTEKKTMWLGLIVIYLFILTICGLVYLLGTSDSDSVYWPDWYILRLPVTIRAAESEKLLLSAGIDGALSAASAEVSYMAIPDIRRVVIADLDKVLVAGDPRRDSYLSRVSEIFKSDGADLVYLPADRSLADYRRTIREIPELSSAQLMDYQASFNWVPALIFLTVSLIYTVAVSGKHIRFVRPAAMLPFAVLVLITLPTTVFPSLLVFVLSPSSLILNKEQRSTFFKFAVVIGFAAASVSLILTAGSENLWSVLVAIVSFEFATAVIFRRNERIHPGQPKKKNAAGNSRSLYLKRRDHRLFDPVSLTGPEAPTIFRRNYHSMIAAAVVIMTILIPLKAATSHPPIPYAAPVSGGFTSFSDMYRLSENQTAGNLPDLSGLVSSVSYQEGFLFGSRYRLPVPGESLSFLEYSDKGTSITTAESTVVEYDDFWFETLLDRELSSGAGRLFQSLGGPSPVFSVTKAPVPELSQFRNLQIVLFGIAVLVMLMLSFSPAHGDLPVRGKFTPILSARRRAQAA